MRISNEGPRNILSTKANLHRGVCVLDNFADEAAWMPIIRRCSCVHYGEFEKITFYRAVRHEE